VLEVKKAGKHANVNCEACHGPQSKHADGSHCGEAGASRYHDSLRPLSRGQFRQPKWFPAVVTAEHSMGIPCNTCHKPHSPKIADEPAAAKGAKK
jgi:hypothetical protein